MAAEQLSGLVERLESITSRLERIDQAGGASGGAPAESAVFVVKFDELLSGPVHNAVTAGKALNDEHLSKQMTSFADGFKRLRAFLDVASRSKKPAQNVLAKLLEPISEAIQNVQEVSQINKRSKLSNHLTAVGECIPCLGWIAAPTLPAPYVKDMLEAGQFYINRVLKDFKGEDQHKEFVRSLQAVLNDLSAYVKEYHTTGVSWNPKGGDAAVEAAKASTGGSAPPPPPGGAPPPPPPPAVAPPTAPTSSSGGDAAKRAELFSALNKGTDISKGLKKVTDDMKTHKNPALRSGPAPFKPHTAPKPVSASKPVAKEKSPAPKPPVFELQGKKWVVEHQQNNQNLVIDQTETKQTVYIYKCTNSVIQVKNKVNSIILDGCKKCGVVCEDLISAVEFVNCASVKCQINGAVPTVSIDKTDGCQVYVSKKSLNTQFITSKSSEMNIAVTQDDGDLVEFPVPEQYRTSWNPDKKSFETTTFEV